MIIVHAEDGRAAGERRPQGELVRSLQALGSGDANREPWRFRKSPEQPPTASRKIEELRRRGLEPTEDGWGGWLGRYQRALCETAQVKRELPAPRWTAIQTLPLDDM